LWRRKFVVILLVIYPRINLLEYHLSWNGVGGAWEQSLRENDVQSIYTGIVSTLMVSVVLGKHGDAFKPSCSGERDIELSMGENGLGKV